MGTADIIKIATPSPRISPYSLNFFSFQENALRLQFSAGSFPRADHITKEIKKDSSPKREKANKLQSAPGTMQREGSLH